MTRQLRILTLLATMALLVAACGGADDADEAAGDAGDGPATSPGETSDDVGNTEAVAGPPVEIRYADLAGEGAMTTGVAIAEQWAERLAEATDGAVSVDFFYSGSLVGASDLLDGISSGVADAGFTPFAYDPTFAPLANVPELPGEAPEMEASLRAAQEYFTTYEPVVQQLEEQNIKYLWGFAHPGDGYLGSQVPIDSVDTLNGMRVRALSPLWARAFTELGMEVVTMSPADLYTALERGTVDGTATFMLGFSDLSWYEQVDYLTPLGTGTSVAAAITMNLDVWNSLSAEQQALVEEESARALDEFINQAQSAFDDAAALISDSGVEIAQSPPPDVADALGELGAEISEEFAADLDDQDLPGTEALETWRQLVEEHS